MRNVESDGHANALDKELRLFVLAVEGDGHHASRGVVAECAVGLQREVVVRNAQTGVEVALGRYAAVAQAQRVAEEGCGKVHRFATTRHKSLLVSRITRISFADQAHRADIHMVGTDGKLRTACLLFGRADRDHKASHLQVEGCGVSVGTQHNVGAVGEGCRGCGHVGRLEDFDRVGCGGLLRRSCERREYQYECNQ